MEETINSLKILVNSSVPFDFHGLMVNKNQISQNLFDFISTSEIYGKVLTTLLLNLTPRKSLFYNLNINYSICFISFLLSNKFENEDFKKWFQKIEYPKINENIWDQIELDEIIKKLLKTSIISNFLNRKETEHFIKIIKDISFDILSEEDDVFADNLLFLPLQTGKFKNTCFFPGLILPMKKPLNMNNILIKIEQIDNNNPSHISLNEIHFIICNEV